MFRAPAEETSHVPDFGEPVLQMPVRLMPVQQHLGTGIWHGLPAALYQLPEGVESPSSTHNRTKS